MKAPAFVQDTWVRASWDSFLTLAENSVYERAKFYYHNGWMRVEMSPVGSSHARDNSLLAQIVVVFALRRNLRVESYITPSLRKSGLAEFQPDVAFYINQSSTPAPGTKPIDLATTALPALVVEVSATTLDDDLSVKRDLYTQVGVGEYWVVDVLAGKVRMFGRGTEGSELLPLGTSSVLAGLSAEILEEALRLGHSKGDTAAVQYILNLPEDTSG